MGRHVLPYAGDGDSLFYQTFSCNKRCLALDLKKPRGREILERLALRADALINNLRGDLPATLGLDRASLGQRSIRASSACTSRPTAATTSAPPGPASTM